MVHEVEGNTIGKHRDVEMITGANGKTNAAFPERVWVRKADVLAEIATYELAVEKATDEDKRDAYQKVLDTWNEKLTTINLLGGDYKKHFLHLHLFLCRMITTQLTILTCKYRMNFSLQLTS